MNSEIYEKTEFLIRRWWLSLLSGIVVVAIGFIIMIHPTASYYTLALLLGLGILFSGIMGMVQCFSSRNYFVRRVWLVLASAADIIIGIVLMFNPLLTGVIIPLLLGFWLIYRGCATLAQGFDLRSYGRRDAGWIILYGGILIALGIAVVWMPSSLSAELVLILVAVGFVAYGISLVSLALRLWEVHRHSRALGNIE